MADKTIRENFFDAKAIGSLWDVAVSLKRGNPLPIDADSVFESEAKLIEYIGDKITTVAYPGQVVAVVNADSTQIFYIDQELNHHPVGTKLDADGKSIKVEDNVLKLVGFDTAADGLLAQVKVDAEGNRTLNWVSIEAIAQGDGNTTYVFTGLEGTSNVYFEVQASDAEAATKIYLDTYSKSEIDAKFTDSKAYVDGIVGKVAEGDTPATGIRKEIADALAEAKQYADENDADTIYDDTALTNRVETLENAGYQNSTQVNTAITSALTAYYNKTEIDGKVTDLEGKISAIPKFAIEVVTAKEDGTPNVETPSSTTVYLIPHTDTKTTDIYDEYIYVNSKWELLGRQKLDLTNYATKTYVTDEIAKLSAEGGAIKVVADDLATLTGEHNALAGDVATLTSDVATLEGIVGNSEAGLVKDVADLKAIDHLTSSDVDNQIDAKLTAADYEGKIATAKNEAIAAALIKSVDEGQFTVTEGELAVNAIAQDKITGLADAFKGVNDSVSNLSTFVGTIPSPYTEKTVIEYINKKATEASESTAAVLSALNTYKSENDTKVNKNTSDIASITTKLNTIEENAQVNKLEGVKVNGVVLEAVEKIVDIPAATADKFGVVKLGSEFKTAEDGTLEVKELNVNKLVQTEGEYLILNGGLASDIK